MGDLGYAVDLGAGDKYKLPSTPGPNLAVASAGTRGRDLDLTRGERLIRPTAVVR